MMGKKTRIAVFAAAAVALLIVIVSLGSSLPSPFTSTYKLDNPSSADSSGEITAIVDSQSRRLLVLDKSDRVTATVAVDSVDSPANVVGDTCVSGDDIYVVGRVYDSAGDFASKELVLKYDTSGTLIDTVYEIESSRENRHIIQTLQPAPGGVVATITHDVDDEAYDGPGIEFVQIDAQGARSLKGLEADSFNLHMVACNAVSGTHAAVNVMGAITEGGGLFDESLYPGCAFTSVAVGDEGEVYAYDDSTAAVVKLDDGEAIWLFDDDGVNSLSYSAGTLAACDMTNNEVCVWAIDDGSLNTIGPELAIAPSLRARGVLVWICALYLLVLIVALIIGWVRKTVQAGEMHKLGSLLAAILVVVIVGVTLSFFSLSAYNESVETRSKEVGAFAGYIDSMSYMLSEDVEQVRDRSVFRESGESLEQTISTLANVDHQLSSLANAANDYDIDIYFTLYSSDERGVFHVYDSAMEYVFGSSILDKGNVGDLEKCFKQQDTPDELFTGSTLRDTTIYRLVPVFASDSEELVGIVELGSRMKSFEATQTNSRLQNAIALLVIIFAIYLAAMEVRESVGRLVDSRRCSKTSAGDALALLARPLSFGVIILMSIDAVMTVLIARSMVDSMETAYSGILVALPAVMLGIGMVMGENLYAKTGARTDVRKLIMISLGALAVFALLAVPVVRMGSLAAYCVAKFLMAFCFGVLYAVCYALPGAAGSTKIYKRSFGDVVHSDTSAAAFGTVLGGYVAQTFGNEWVYAVIAIVGVLVLLAALAIVPRRYGPLESASDETQVISQTRKLALSSGALPMALLVVCPMMIANGYNSFLFPLYTADAGLSSSAISNMFVLSQLIVFVLISTIISLRERRGSWNVITLTLVLLGVVLLLLSLNRTVVWAVVAIVLIGIFCKVIEGWRGVWIGNIQQNGFSHGLAVSSMLSVRSTMLVAQPLVLGLLLSVGESYAVIVVGAFCVVCAIAFFFSTRKLAIATR